MIGKRKNTLSGRFDEKKRAGLVHNLAEMSYRTHRIVCFVILGFQGLMIVATLIRGTDFSSALSAAYFGLYVTLFLLSLAAYFVSRQIMSKSGTGRRDEIYLNLQTCYGLLITLWGICITLLDQYGTPGLDVFSYVSLAVASFVLFRPWQSVAMFIGEFAAINILLPFFPHGTENLFGHLLNTLFICVLSIAVSIFNYRGKCASYFDKTTIQEQYDKISEMNLKLNRLAVTDDLTDMYSRRYLESEAFAARWGKAERVAGIMIDIDYFKQYNDAFGHVAGDRCLKELALIIETFCVRLDAEAVRFGGEEFFLCLFECDAQTALSEAETLRATVEAELVEGTVSRRVTISLGVCAAEKDSELTFTDLLMRSDRALYDAKRQGRNRVVFAE